MLTKRSFVRRTSLMAAALLVSAVASVVSAAGPAVLTLVPGDAYGVIAINNIRTLANKASNAATRLNLPAPPDLVGYATRNIGITKGFDANSSAALVLLKPSPERLAEGYFNGPPPAVLLLPTSDAKGMLEPFAPGTADSKGISQVTLPSNPDEKGYVAVIEDKWIALAQNRDDLMSYLARADSFAKTASPETIKVFDNNDLVAWFNVDKLGVGMDKMLDQQQNDFAGMMDLANNVANAAAKPEAAALALQKQMISGMFGFAKEFLKDANASMATMRLTDSGATVGLVGDFKTGTPIGKFVASQAGGAPVTLKGLPGGNFLVAGAMKWDAESVSKMIGDFTTQLLADPDVAKDPHAADMAKGIENLKQLMAITKGTSFVLLDPPAGGKDGIFCGAALMDVTDPKKYMDLQREMINSQFAQSMNPNVKQTITVSDKPTVVNGVQLTKINMKMEMAAAPADNAIAAQIQGTVNQAIQKMYGPDGMTMYMGAVGQKVLVIYGSDNGTMEAAVAAAKGNTDALSTNEGVKAVRDQVVANPIMFGYLPITRWFTLAQAMLMPTADGAAPTPVPAAIASAPPVVVSVGVSGKLITAETHVPIATVMGIQEAVKRLQEAMTGPPAPPLP